MKSEYIFSFESADNRFSRVSKRLIACSREPGKAIWEIAVHVGNGTENRPEDNPWHSFKYTSSHRPSSVNDGVRNCDSVANLACTTHSTVLLTSTTVMPDKPLIGAVQFFGRRPNRFEHDTVMALIWEAESIRARTVCQVPQWSQIWTSVVLNNTAKDSSDLAGVAAAHKDASPLDEALSVLRRVEKPRNNVWCILEH